MLNYITDNKDKPRKTDFKLVQTMRSKDIFIDTRINHYSLKTGLYVGFNEKLLLDMDTEAIEPIINNPKQIFLF